MSISGPGRQSASLFPAPAQPGLSTWLRRHGRFPLRSLEGRIARNEAEHKRTRAHASKRSAPQVERGDPAPAYGAAPGRHAGPDAGPGGRTGRRDRPERGRQGAVGDHIADTLIYDTEHGIVTASGNVEISTNQRRLLADEVRYDQKSGKVVARGNVVQIEPSGDALFGDEVEVTSDLREGFVQTVGIVLKDNSRIAATQGTRREGNIVTLDRAVYSPCPLCKDGSGGPPVADQGAARHPG